jgi:ADP-ribose pyrophosphatase
MPDPRELADRPADLSLSEPELLADGYRPYRRYRVTLRHPAGAVGQTRDVLIAGKVVAVLPIDLVRQEIVLIRQFRLAAHLATGNGDMIEVAAGQVDAGEQPAESARRECLEEIGVAPARLVELFSFLASPGTSDEEVVMFAAAVDAAKVPHHSPHLVGDERIETLRIPISEAIALIDGSRSRIRSAPALMALQWLALNRARLPLLLG